MGKRRGLGGGERGMQRTLRVCAEAFLEELFAYFTFPLASRRLHSAMLLTADS